MRLKHASPRSFSVIFIPLLIVFGVYFLRGREIIRRIYEGKSLGILNPFIEGQKIWPLETYFQMGDAMMSASALLILLGVLLWQVKKSESRLSDFQKWILAGMTAFFIVAMGHFKPELLENELVSLINPRRLLAPGYLAADWMWQRGDYGHFVFDLMVSPLTLFMDNLSLALGGRVLVWTFLIFSFVRFARTLGLQGWEFVAAFAFWLYASQSLTAGEWVFSGFEAKCFSYAFLFLALDFALKQKWLWAAFFSGLAIDFHILVGGWGALALSAIPLMLSPKAFFKRLAAFSILALISGLPGLLSSFFNLMHGGKMTDSNYAIEVLFHGAHHLDPHTFLSLWGASRLLLYYFLTCFLVLKSFERKFAVPLFVFLNVLMGVFILGILARETGAFYFLFLYPFRLGPVFLLLFFSISAVHFLARPQAVLRTNRLAILGLSAFLIFEAVYFQMPVTLFKQTRGFFFEWTRHFSKKEDDDFSKLVKWIKAETTPESVFVAPPWEYRFWIATERPQVANYKGIPANPRNQEWMVRLQDLNGGRPFRTRGVGPLAELKENYPKLGAEELSALRLKYGARYYLVTRERTDLPFRLLYSNNTYYLYRL